MTINRNGHSITSKFTTKEFICNMLGKGVEGNVQISMEYHCIDINKGEEIKTIKIFDDGNGIKISVTC